MSVRSPRNTREALLGRARRLASTLDVPEDDTESPSQDKPESRQQIRDRLLERARLIAQEEETKTEYERHEEVSRPKSSRRERSSVDAGEDADDEGRVDNASKRALMRVRAHRRKTRDQSQHDTRRASPRKVEKKKGRTAIIAPKKSVGSPDDYPQWRQRMDARLEDSKNVLQRWLARMASLESDEAQFQAFRKEDEASRSAALQHAETAASEADRHLTSLRRARERAEKEGADTVNRRDEILQKLEEEERDVRVRNERDQQATVEESYERQRREDELGIERRTLEQERRYILEEERAARGGEEKAKSRAAGVSSAAPEALPPERVEETYGGSSWVGKAENALQELRREEEMIEQKGVEYGSGAYSAEWDAVEAEVTEFEANERISGDIMEIEQERLTVEKRMDTLRGQVRVRGEEHAREKQKYAEWKESVSREDAQHAVDIVKAEQALSVAKEDVENYRAEGQQWEQRMLDRDAHEKVRFEVILRQEKLVEAEEVRFLDNWQKEYSSLERNLEKAENTERKLSTADLESEPEQKIEVVEEKKTVDEGRTSPSWEEKKHETREKLESKQDEMGKQRDIVHQLQSEREALEDTHPSEERDARMYEEKYVDVCRRLRMQEEALRGVQREVIALSEELRMLVISEQDDAAVVSSLKISGATGRGESSTLDVMRLKRRIQDKLLEREAKLRLLHRWRAKAARDHSLLASAVASERAKMQEEWQQLLRSVDEAEEKQSAARNDLERMKGRYSAFRRAREETVSKERQRVEAFEAYVAEVEAEVSRLVSRRRELREAWERLEEDRMQSAEARKIAQAAAEVREMQAERDALEAYKRGHEETFQQWKEQYGNDRGRRMEEDQLADMQRVFRQQRVERKKYFHRLLKRRAELPNLTDRAENELAEIRVRVAENSERRAKERAEAEVYLAEATERWQAEWTVAEEALNAAASKRAEITDRREEIDRRLLQIENELRLLQESILKSSSERKEQHLQEEADERLREIGKEKSAQKEKWNRVIREKQTDGKQLREDELDAGRAATKCKEEGRRCTASVKRCPEEYEARSSELRKKKQQLRARITRKEAEVNRICREIKERERLFGDSVEDEDEEIIVSAEVEHEDKTEEDLDVGFYAKEVRHSPPRYSALERVSTAPARTQYSVMASEDETFVDDAIPRDVGELISADSRRIFGPYSSPLGTDDLVRIQRLLVGMIRGCFVYKKVPGTATNARSVGQVVRLNGVSVPIVERRLVISFDLSRIELRDERRKSRLPETFILLEHIERVWDQQGISDFRLSGPAREEMSVLAVMSKGGNSQWLMKEQNSLEIWLEGLRMLMTNKKNIFYLKHNLKNLVGESFLARMYESRR